MCVPGVIFTILALFALASCGREPPTGPGITGPRGRLGLHLTFPKGAAFADRLEFSVFTGTQRIAGPVVTLNSGSFSVALQVPSGSRRVAVVKAFGGSGVTTNLNPGSGAVLLGVSAPFSISADDTAEVPVNLQSFVTTFVPGETFYTDTARLSWHPVPGATRYTVHEQPAYPPAAGRTRLAEMPGGRGFGAVVGFQAMNDKTTSDTTIVVNAEAASTFRTFVVRAENSYALGGWSMPVSIELVPSGPPPTGSNWTVLNDGTGTAPGYRVFQMSAWSAVNRTLYIFGGDSGDSFADSTLWAFSLATNQWTEVSAGSGGPAGREYGSLAVSNDGMQVYLFGGISQDTTVTELDLWQYDLSAHRWLRLASTAVAQRLGMSYEASIDAVLWVPAGSTTTLNLYVPTASEIWTFDLGQRTWIAPAAPGDIPARDVPATAYSPETGELFVFGGIPVNTTQSSVDSTLWSWSENSSSWTMLPVDPGATAPARGWAGGAAGTNGHFFFMGGIGSTFTGGTEDVWEYRPGATTGAWHRYSAGQEIGYPFRPCLAYDVSTNRVITYGGGSTAVRALDLSKLGAIDVRR